MSADAKARIAASLRAAYKDGSRSVAIGRAQVVASNYWRGRPATNSARAVLLACAVGPRSEKHKANISVARRAYFAANTVPAMSKEQRLKRSEESKKAWRNLSEQDRKDRGKKAIKTTAQKEKVANAMRRHWDSLTDKERAAWIKSSRPRSSSLERTVAALLDALGIQYVAQESIGRYVVDFFVASRRLVIECDGLYWHSRPGMKERDARKDELLNALGYTVLRLPEAQIKSGAVIETLKLVVDQK